MSNITAKVIGGSLKELDVETVGEAQADLGLSGNYTATVNGEPESADYELDEYDYVLFTESIKGGL